MSTFFEKLTNAVEHNNSLLCVGLDPDPHKFPTHFAATIDTAALTAWGRALIEQTADLVCCYKPNIAFYEQYGPAGLEALRQTIAAVPADIPVPQDDGAARHLNGVILAARPLPMPVLLLRCSARTRSQSTPTWVATA